MAWTKWTEHNIWPATWHFSVPASKSNNIIAIMLLLIANLYIALKPGVMIQTLTLKSCISYKSNWWEMFSENLLGSTLLHFSRKQKFFLSFSSTNFEFVWLPMEYFATTHLPIPLTQPDPLKSAFLLPCGHLQPIYQASEAWNKLYKSALSFKTAQKQHLLDALV